MKVTLSFISVGGCSELYRCDKSGTFSAFSIRGLLIYDRSTNQALETLDISPRIRKKCLKALYRTCGRNAILPSSFQIPHCYDRQGVALCQGGFADVWKGRHLDVDVAVKVIRMSSHKELQKMVGVGLRSPFCELIH